MKVIVHPKGQRVAPRGLVAGFLRDVTWCGRLV